eukprot:TRINITY_DN2714_c0_g1_i1.p1 TRINITY_DN2714_c0_g1~~TRINITY_DN2714_c0_g1_i1.p1  ORF type:complete len:115 (-),score=31.29 TRINITY_DN2714_c0_g1_i1:130-474(-)
MSSAGRPTYNVARGGPGSGGGYRSYVPTSGYSSKDQNAHSVVKTRKTGQGAPDELKTKGRDELRRNLEEKEMRTSIERGRDTHRDRDRERERERDDIPKLREFGEDDLYVATRL